MGFLPVVRVTGSGAAQFCLGLFNLNCTALCQCRCIQGLVCTMLEPQCWAGFYSYSVGTSFLCLSHWPAVQMRA